MDCSSLRLRDARALVTTNDGNEFVYATWGIFTGIELVVIDGHTSGIDNFKIAFLAIGQEPRAHDENETSPKKQLLYDVALYQVPSAIQTFALRSSKDQVIFLFSTYALMYAI